MKSGFFKVYSSFDEFQANNHDQVVAWADLDIMSKAVRNHFLLQHVRRGGTSVGDFYYRFMPRPMNICGTRTGILVNVQLHGEEYPTKYSVKCHHFGMSSFYQKASPPDIREIFCYKLLEVIEVGPAVQFIISKEGVGNKISVYIATKWRDDFIPLSDLNKEEDINVEALVQLLLLKVLFNIDNLHADNCQWNGTNTAAIISLMPIPCAAHQDVKEVLLGQHRMNWNHAPADLLFEKCSTERFLEIVKKWLQEWDLLSKIDKAAALIKHERDRVKMLENDFRMIEESEYTVAMDLDEYLDAVKSNVKNLTSALGLNV
ncbi:hypothetical protein FO519_000241 [Halicephalobus sp. NKZ332]|nr:hypothetical protein FO519_000241 [Halicephalobus sp. NKZ332]